MAATSQNISKGTEDTTQLNNNVEEKSTTPPLQETSKKSKKDDRTRKDEKNVEQFMKSLNSVPTLEEKLSLVCKKYVQTADENKKLHFYIKHTDKRHTLVLKEKDQLQLECNKTVLVKSKLENLCRELQKQNRAIKEESLLRIREEEEKRKETQAKFQTTLTEITTLLQQNNEKNTKLRDDNVSMTEKFKSVMQQYQLREEQVDKMSKQMSLESQLSDAKLQKANLEHQAEKERLFAEMEHMKVELAQYRAKIMELQGTETGLRSQIAIYTDKYDQFQSALQKSNQVFGGFKSEMEKMSKKIQKLEKESLSWKRKFETAQAALAGSCGEAAAAARQRDHMQRLCRLLQGERTQLLSTLKEHNIERPPLPPLPATPPPPPENNDKVEAMAANCVQLKQSLAHLQNQLNVLTNQKATNEPTKPEKSKKSKSKKNKDKLNQQESGSRDNAKVQIEEVNETTTDLSSTVAEGTPSLDELTTELSSTVPEEMATLEESIANNEVNVENGEEAKDAAQPEEKVAAIEDGINEENVDSPSDADKTLENLIDAISQANISLGDLQVEDINMVDKVMELTDVEEVKPIADGNAELVR